MAKLLGQRSGIAWVVRMGEHKHRAFLNSSRLCCHTAAVAVASDLLA